MNIIDFLVQVDVKLFLTLNGWRSSFFDFLMYWISDKYIWVPFYAFVLYLIARVYKIQTFYILGFIVLLITLSDQSSVHLFKNVFERLRPCHNPHLEGMVNLINNRCGGQFGFISSHASNSYALASFVFFLLRRHYFKFAVWMLVWAAIVGYSRIYLGVHYPADVFAGSIVGFLWGWLVYALFSWFSLKVCKNKNVTDIQSS